MKKNTLVLTVLICLFGVDSARAVVQGPMLITYDPKDSYINLGYFEIEDSYGPDNSLDINVANSEITFTEIAVGIRIDRSARDYCASSSRFNPFGIGIYRTVTCTLPEVDSDNGIVGVDTGDGSDSVTATGSVSAGAQITIRVYLGQDDDTANISINNSLTDTNGYEAANVDGEDGDDTISFDGSAAPNSTVPYSFSASGGDGNDSITGSSSTDLLHGSAGQDVIRGGSGDDEIWTYIVGIADQTDGYADRVWCGTGDDRVYSESIDNVAAGCEN